MKTKKRLLMVSLDAVSSDDVQLLQKMPHFAELCKQGTLVCDVSTVLVSNTYPAHTSIITGTYPNKHGIVDNVTLSPKKKFPNWCYQACDIKVPTLYEKAKAQGLKTCAILYPVTGGATAIEYNFPEIAGKMNPFARIYKMLTEGSAWFILSNLWRHWKHLQGISQPALDDFTTSVAADTILRHKPDVLTLHLIDADAQKHTYGPDSEQASKALLRHDNRLGKLIDALQEAGTYDETSIIVFSDHGCLPVHTAVDPNEYLIKQNIIRKRNNQIIDHDAYFHNAGGTTFLKLYCPKKKNEVSQVVTNVLKESYVGRKLTDEEMTRSGMDNNYIAGLEAADGYYFGKPGYKGQHGYASMHEGNLPFYLAVGKSICKGKEVLGGCITDICPLAAQMLDIPQWEMDGILHRELLC